MIPGKIFCTGCTSYVEPVIKDKKLTGTVKGKQYTYTGKTAVCERCGKEFSFPETDDANRRALDEAYRKENGIISLDKIREIPVRYAIGRRPLSLLLGWGEHTFSRYAEGDMPTKLYSDILLHIYEDPGYYSKLLESGRDKLRSESAYIRSRKAVSALLAADTVQKYLLSKCGDISPSALGITLWYVRGFYRAMYGTFADKDDPLTDDLIKVCDSVIENICCYSSMILERFMEDEMIGFDSPDDDIYDRFSKIMDEYGDISSYAEAMFSKVHPSGSS